MEPLTCTTPKPLLPLLNLPFLTYLLRRLKDFSIEEVIVSTGYLPETFSQVVDEAGRAGLNVTCVREETPLGTCGAVKNIAHLLTDTFLVFNGDILTDLNLEHIVEFHRSKKAHTTISLAPVDDPTSYGLVPLDKTGRVVEFLEKPSWDEVTTDLINAGTYVLEPEVLDWAPEGEQYSFERGLFPSLLENGKAVYGFSSSAYWLDIGAPDKYLKAHRDLLDGKLVLGEIAGEQIKPRVWVGKGCRIDPDATVLGPAVVGEDCRIGANATVFGFSTLGDGCVIGEGVTLEGCVLFEGCHVDESSVVRHSILGKGVRIGKKVHVEETAVLGDDLIIGDDNQLRRGIRVWPGAVLDEHRVRF